jgi:hypothetical protein
MNKTIKYFIFVLPLLNLVRSTAQQFCFGVLSDSIPNTTNVVCYNIPSSTAFINKYRKAEIYIPKPNARHKIINLNFNVFQNSAGTLNFPLSDPNSINIINQVLNWVKMFFTSNNNPTDQPNCLGINNLNSKYIDFNINGIYFYQNDGAFNAQCDFGLFLNIIKSVDPNRLKSLNFCTTHGTTSFGGCANEIPMVDNHNSYLPNYNLCAVTFYIDKDIQNFSHWAGSQNIAHEIGHLLGLRHTYVNTFHTVNDYDCAICLNYSLTNHVDYLHDIHGPVGCSLCPNSGIWSNPAASPNDGITNNLMGGSIDNSYASPKQIGIMHRSLYLLSPGKYTQCTYDPNNPFEVDTVELWNFINCAPKKGQIINGLLNQMNEKYFNLLV